MSYGNTPLYLLTRNPAVKTIADFTDADRITVPAVKSSVQAMMLQMAAEKLWGQFDKLDHLTVSRGHPDAIARACCRCRARSTAPSARRPMNIRRSRTRRSIIVTTSEDIFGGPAPTACST